MLLEIATYPTHTLVSALVTPPCFTTYLYGTDKSLSDGREVFHLLAYRTSIFPFNHYNGFAKRTSYALRTLSLWYMQQLTQMKITATMKSPAENTVTGPG